MTRLALALPSSLLFLAIAAAQEDSSIALHELLQAAKLPPGYNATTQDLKVGDKVLGQMMLITKPNQISKVIVRIESRNLAATPARRAAAKAYVNSFASGLLKAEYKLVDKSIPDIAKEIFERPISVRLVFENAAGKKLWSNQEIFFTDKGFVVQTIADDAETFAALMKWASTVKPKALPKR